MLVADAKFCKSFAATQETQFANEEEEQEQGGVARVITYPNEGQQSYAEDNNDGFVAEERANAMSDESASNYSYLVAIIMGIACVMECKVWARKNTYLFKKASMFSLRIWKEKSLLTVLL